MSKGHENRVVVTGLGVVSPIGIGHEAFWGNLTSGRCGIGRITRFDASAFPVRIGAEVDGLDTAAIVAQYPQAARLRDRKVALALAAADEAIADAALDGPMLSDALLCVGAGLEEFRLENLTPYASAADLTDAIAGSILDDLGDCPLQTPLDQTACLLGERYGFGAGRWTNCSACAAGAQAIGEAWQMLRRGSKRIALAGATDSMLNPLGLGGFSLLKVLSDENECPDRACRPFDATRKGTVLGEGAAFVVMETLDHARQRGAAIHTELLGYGTSMDAFRATDPDPGGTGAAESMHRALRSAGIGPHDVDCVSAHGTGTPKNDAVETAAIKECLGRRAHEIPVHAVKSMTGHMIAASGAVEAVAAALTISRRRVPPTINLTNADPQCDLDYVADGARAFAGNVVLSNSFGFGGQNATLLLGRFD